MRVTELTGAEYGGYREFLGRMPLALFYHSLEFKDLVERELGQTPRYLLLKDGEQIRGILPCFLKDNPRHGNVLNSLPFFGSNGGILLDSEHDTPGNRKLLLDAFLDLARSSGCISAVIITSPFEERFDEYRDGLKPDLMDQRIGQVTELKPDNLELFSTMRRRGVLKAKKAGITVGIEQEVSNADLLRFYDMHCQNMDRVSGIKKTYSMVSALNGCPSSRVILARENGELTAGLLCLYFNRTVEYYIPVFDEEHKNSHALSLAIYEGMNRAYADGFQYWNFGGTWLSQDGVYTFKQHFGAVGKPYYYYIKLFREPGYFKALGRQTLLEDYPWCYVIPFSALEGGQ